MKVTLIITCEGRTIQRHGEDLEPYQRAHLTRDPVYVMGFGLCRVREFTCDYDLMRTRASTPLCARITLERITQNLRVQSL